MNRLTRRVVAFAVIAAAGCTMRPQLPPPSELADRSESVREQVMANESLIAMGDAADHLRELDATLAAISSRYGRNSIELQQAATEIGLLLIRQGERYDLAERYFQRALELSREVFGTNHRETGYALHDFAIVRSKVNPEPFANRVEPFIREAIDVRTRVLGWHHKETAGSERTLAEMMLASWRRLPAREPHSQLLFEAEWYLAHAMLVFRYALGNSHFEVTDLRYLQVEIALARQEYRKARKLAQDLVRKHGQRCSSLATAQTARQFEVAALRGLGRGSEADALEQAGPEVECMFQLLLREEQEEGVPTCTEEAADVADESAVESSCGAADVGPPETGD